MSRITKSKPREKKTRNLLQDRLDSLVASGEISIATGLQLKVENDGLPLVVDRLPSISRDSLGKIRSRILWNRHSHYYDWQDVYNKLTDLMGDTTETPTCTHKAVWDMMRSTHKKAMEDYDIIMDLYHQLEENPKSVKDLQIRGVLPQRVCRFVGRNAERTCDKERGDFWTGQLSSSHRGLHVLVKEILTYAQEAKENPLRASSIGRNALGCFRTLLDARELKKPGDLMDVEDFRYLMYRADDIARGNREASPA
ncbi:hypothetical protein NM208_g3863 [Fusarium decemcellulare]|uniref:Uncharacterized protein n=1 Tax=Fusarium decemcellulare TaxID=57161 RepID=A0ACC1SMP5_9HYPO|nr:hypothetical protein NM208_g3863 [Fusarium decemcellulare]